MKHVIYQTYFDLEFAVNVKEANEYLQQYDMTEYLKNDCARHLGISENRIHKIEWKLVGSNWEDSEEGVVTLVADELTAEELAKISDWVSGQNSDGLGEGFEQVFERDGEDDDDYDYDGCGYGMCSFDWRYNDYKFRKVEVPE